jgi:2-isopropylmalate synthase
MSNKIIIFDTTLRDGEQCPGATMLLKEKIAVASKLDDMGVDVIEAGFAAASKGDTECIDAVSKALKNATVCSLARGVISDIEAAAKSLENAKKPRIHTFISTSRIHIEQQFRMTFDHVLKVIDETVRKAKSYCDDVEWSAMDATRSDMEFLMKAVEMAINAGAKTINIPDTVGYTQPDEYRTMMSQLTKAFPKAIFSVHCHNDLGLATANSLAGVLGGARQIECTINGIGERAGNASMEEVVMAIKTRPDIYQCETNIDTRKIYPTSRFLAATIGFAIQKNKAIVGANAFAHESGIHQDGMLKNRNTYEIMVPESVGVTKTQIILGKHSGRAAFKNRLTDWGIQVDDQQLQLLFEEFKALCDRKKYVTEDEILDIVKNKQSSTPSHVAQLVSFDLKQLGVDQYSVDLILKMGDQELKGSAKSKTPLDAVFMALNTMTKSTQKPELFDFELHGVSHQTDPQNESYVSLKTGDMIVTGHARDNDPIKAAASAYISALNKMLSKGIANG